MQNNEGQSVEDECMCVFLYVCVVYMRVCVTQPLPGISDGYTVRLKWTSSKDVNPNNHPYTLTVTGILIIVSLKQIHTQMETNIRTHMVERNNHTEFQGIQMHACTWTMGGFYVSTLSPCFVQIIP